MFERFSDRARKVMALANSEAILRGHCAINSAHILKAMLRNGSGAGVQTLKDQSVDLNKVVQDLEIALGVGDHSPEDLPAKRPMAADAKAVVDRAVEEARSLGDNRVGTEHLLIGLMADPTTPAGAVLTLQRITLEGCREAVGLLMQQATPDFKPVVDVRPSQLAAPSASELPAFPLLSQSQINDLLCALERERSRNARYFLLGLTFPVLLAAACWAAARWLSLP
jgi:ATP-dependent Clp protease ATP-binding subunit ClpA